MKSAALLLFTSSIAVAVPVARLSGLLMSSLLRCSNALTITFSKAIVPEWNSPATLVHSTLNALSMYAGHAPDL
jgi:hypothetical protein